MALINKTQPSFSGGIISTELLSRIDYDKLASGLRQCENFIVRPVGGVQYAAGTKFIASGLTESTRLIPFAESKDVYFCLAFEAGKISVYNKSGLITQITTPYTEEQIKGIKYAQFKNQLYLVHEDVIPKILKRNSDNTWVLNDATFNGSLLNSSYISSITIMSGTAKNPETVVVYNKWKYACSVLDADGNESLPIYSVFIANDISLTNQQITVTVNLAKTTGLKSIYIYRIKGGEFYFVQKLDVIQDTTTYTFIDCGLVADETKSVKEVFSDFGTGNYPRSVAFYNQRLIYGGTKKNPNDIWGSQVGHFDDFTNTILHLSSESFNLTLASGSSDQIECMIPMDNLIIFSSGKIWKVAGSSASNMQAEIESYSSISDLVPVATKKSVLYTDASLNTILNFVYSYELNGYTGQNLDILARELFDGYKFVAQSFRNNPFPVYFVVREDGAMLSLTYLREENIYAWSKLTTQGEYKDVCCIASQINDSVFVKVKRGEIYCLEYFADQIAYNQDVNNSCYLHSAKIIENNSSDTITGITWLANKKVAVVADKDVYMDVLVDANGSFTIEGLSAYSRIVVGLTYRGIIQTIPFEVADNIGGTSFGKGRKICNATVMLYKTRGYTWGTNLEKLTEIKPYTQISFGEDIPLETGKFNLPVSSNWGLDTSFFVVQNYPLPCFLQNITLELTYGSKQ